MAYDDMNYQEEFQSRLDRETAKALTKYGAGAELPGGHPEKDIHDYTINEIVGLVRYANMMISRLEQFRDLKLIPRKIAGGMIDEAYALRSTAFLFGEIMILQRRRLRELLGSLGDPEYTSDA